MSLCPTLAKIQRNQVDFDAKNPEHMKAFEMLCLRSVAKQHPTLRFNCQHPFTDVRSMMYHVVGEQHLETILSNTTPVVKRVSLVSQNQEGASAA